VTRRPVLVHVTTVDMSLVLLLLPQLVAFRDAGYDVVGVSSSGSYVAELERHGIRHLALPRSTRALNLADDVATARHFSRLCRTLRPEIVHTHNPKPGIYGRVVACATGVPVVVNTVHGLYAQPGDSFGKRTIVYGLERVAAACSDAELVQNPEDLPVLRRLGVPESKLHLLGNGIDLARFDPALHAPSRRSVRAELGIGERDVVVGVVGRLVREKGYREVFEAARTVMAKQSNVRFVVVGPSEPDKRDALSSAEVGAAAAAGVILLGARNDVQRLYAAMDLYVLASHREGFPRSAMEAAAMGLPIVATDIRGCRQVVDDGISGRLVPVGDAMSLARVITEIVTDSSGSVAMGLAARKKALQCFDDRQQIARTLSVYARLLERARNRGRNRTDGVRR
jgi:glycosyltransferase involved in cell wall biosynthesis